MQQNNNANQTSPPDIRSLKDYSLAAWCWMMVASSFVGFAIEDVWLLFTKGYANNRNMYLPFLLGYGLAVLGVWLFFGEPTRPARLNRVSPDAKLWKRILSYLLLVFVFVCIAEIILGYSVNKSCEIDYWNYENLPLHITKYTSVFTSLGFASAITVYMTFIFPRAMKLFSRLNTPVFRTVGIILVILLVVDYLLSFGYMVRFKDYHLVWKISL